MAAVESNAAAARFAGASGERGVSAPGAGEMDGRLIAARTRFADAFASWVAPIAHRDQMLPLHVGKFSAAPARAVGRRSERATGSIGRGPLSGCTVGHGRRDTGVSGCRKPQPLAREVECGAR